MHTNDKTKIVKLCRKYTELTEHEIDILLRKASAADELAEVFDCDIFIDAPLKNSTASIVLYHVFPVTKKSLYEKSPVGQPALKINEPGVWKVSRFGGSLKGYKAFTQENMFIRQNIHAITDGEKILGAFIMEKAFHESTDDTDTAESDYMIMSAKLNKYIDDAIYFFDDNGKLIFQNERADSFSHNISSENVYYDDLFGKQVPYRDLFINEREKFETEIQIDEKFYMMQRILLKDDTLKFAVILRDITQLKYKEAEIISKTEAIRETHHRIKNNLQTIASLFRMERRRASNQEVEHILTDNMNRVLSIAATHDILARQLGDSVELSEVLKYIIYNIQRSYSLSDNIELTVDAEKSIIVLSDVATSVSLIVNELVQNSYTHAFTNKGEGKIHVSLKKEKDEIVITVSDNGVGFSIDDIKGDSLGLIIVQNYVKDKLKGTIQFNKRHEGMEITFRFK